MHQIRLTAFLLLALPLISFSSFFPFLFFPFLWKCIEIVEKSSSSSWIRTVRHASRFFMHFKWILHWKNDGRLALSVLDIRPVTKETGVGFPPEITSKMWFAKFLVKQNALECGQTLYNSGRHLFLPGLLLYSTSDRQNLNFPLFLNVFVRAGVIQKRTLNNI